MRAWKDFETLKTLETQRFAVPPEVHRQHGCHVRRRLHSVCPMDVMRMWREFDTLKTLETQRFGDMERRTCGCGEKDTRFMESMAATSGVASILRVQKLALTVLYVPY